MCIREGGKNVKNMRRKTRIKEDFDQTPESHGKDIFYRKRRDPKTPNSGCQNILVGAFWEQEILKDKKGDCKVRDSTPKEPDRGPTPRGLNKGTYIIVNLELVWKDGWMGMVQNGMQECMQAKLKTETERRGTERGKE